VLGVERQRARSSLHQRIAGALSRAAAVQETSRELIAEYRVTRRAVRATVDATHRQREAREQLPPDK